MLSMERKEIIKKAQGCATLGGETERGISLKENGMDEMPDVANQGELGILRESCLKKLIEVCGKWKCDYWIEQNCKEIWMICQKNCTRMSGSGLGMNQFLKS